jgi:hypothetical protein
LPCVLAFAVCNMEFSFFNFLLYIF